MNKIDLKDQAGITYNIITRLSKGKIVSMEGLYKICKWLQCNIGDIMEFKFDWHHLNKMKGTEFMGKRQLSEEDIKARYITPAITNAGWDIKKQVRLE